MKILDYKNLLKILYYNSLTYIIKISLFYFIF